LSKSTEKVAVGEAVGGRVEVGLEEKDGWD
jgi:hypothetical protein